MIIVFRSSGKSNIKTAELLDFSVVTVKNIYVKYKKDRKN